VEYLRSSTTPQSSDLPSREALSTRIEHAQQQLRTWQAQLAQDAQQIPSHTENPDSRSISAGYRLAIRGALLTDLRRMLDEVHEIFEMTSHPSLSGAFAHSQ